jgi:ATP-dependent Lhr-like helicase
MSDPLAAFSPAVQTWFRRTFGQPTAPQAAGWPAIQRGDHTLILAPTGSGKTLAAFLWGIDEIFRIPHSAFCNLVYISPLKALNNDIERNLRAPLAGIRETAARLGETLPPLRVAVRTGDTPASARAAMIQQPPHILITTPESLYLLLTSPRAREMLRSVRTVIVDEIHTLVGEKRGVHLSLSLERLEHLAAGPIQRIGLSATVRPLEEAARFLGGRKQESGVRGQESGSGRRAAICNLQFAICIPPAPSPS